MRETLLASASCGRPSLHPLHVGGPPCVCFMCRDVPAGFIGFADTIAEIISDHPVQDRDDDQLYYTELYLDQEKRVRGVH